MGRTDAQCVRASELCREKKRRVDNYLQGPADRRQMAFRENALRHLVAEMGSSQIVYGTDAPFAWPAAPDFILNVPFPNDVQKEEILGNNLTKLLKLSPRLLGRSLTAPARAGHP